MTGGANPRSSPHRHTNKAPASIIPVVTQVDSKHKECHGKLKHANRYVHHDSDEGIQPWHAANCWHIGLGAHGTQGEVEKKGQRKGTGKGYRLEDHKF